MIVYADRECRLDTAEAITELRRLAGSLSFLIGEARRLTLDRLLIESGQLAQGLLDASFRSRGMDEWDPLHRACARLTVEAARMHPDLGGSARGFLDSLDALALQPLARSVDTVEPEGYALYSLAPQQYATAAAPLRGKLGVVIGLRSIGTSLAAVVAVAAGVKRLPVTLRPVGPPFERHVKVGDSLERKLRRAAARGERFAIVDEGPGLSGSSFGAAADWLESIGIVPERIHFFPSHPGDVGPRAGERHRRRWNRASRHPAVFVLPGEFSDFAGCEDLSAGAWRRHRCGGDEALWPPACTGREQRKFLLTSADGDRWLAKFAGFGRCGERKAAMARRLSEAGLTPEFERLCRGFMLWRWRGDCGVVREQTPDRARLIERMAEYLAFRWKNFGGTEGEHGATAEQLLEMAAQNLRESLGDAAAERVMRRWGGVIDDLDAARQPRVTDNRLHRWEWLITPSGELLKTDAVDHAMGHDCIGLQDLMWDVAGAVEEWEFAGGEIDELTRRIERRCDWRGDRELLAFHRGCYLAFWLGHCTMHAEIESVWNPAEGDRLRRRSEWYAARLHRWVDGAGWGAKKVAR